MEEEHLGHSAEGPTDSIVYQHQMPVLVGRPRREHPIDSDDILNLVIALNVADSLERFLELV